MDRMLLNFFPDFRIGDFETICCVACPQNIIETELLLLTLKSATNDFFEGNMEYSENLLSVANRLMKSNDLDTLQEGQQLLNNIIYRTPITTTIFLEAVLARSIYHVRIQKYPLARNDLVFYKTLDPKLMKPDGLVLGQTLLCLSLYFMREMPEARYQLHQLEEALARLPLNMVHENLELKSYLQQLEKYKNEIMDSVSNIQYEIKSKNNGLNTRGCHGLYSANPKTKDEVILVEDLNFFQFNIPLMNCEVCGVYREPLYTCSECRYKTYCSLRCSDSDRDGHQIECYGYKIGIIQMLDATLLLKVFLQVTKFLSPGILSFTQDHGPIRYATAAWNLIVKYSNSNYSPVGMLLSYQPEYQQLGEEKCRQLTTTAFRLAVFLFNETNIIKTFVDPLELPKVESIKIVAALLLRLNLHIALNSQRIEIHRHQNIPISVSLDCLEYQTGPGNRMNMNAFSYYSINAHPEFVNCFNRLQEDILFTKDLNSRDRISSEQDEFPSNKSQCNLMSEYNAKLSLACLKGVTIKNVRDFEYDENPTSVEFEQCLEKLSTSERCKLLSTISQYFHKYLYEFFFKDKSRRQEKVTVCVNKMGMSKIEISELINNTAFKNIETDTELTTSLDFDPLTSCKDLDIICKHDVGADRTMMKQYESNKEGDYGECSQCQITHSKLLEQHNRFITYILREIRAKESGREVNQRELAILYGTYNSYVTMHFSEGSELRLSGVLSLVEFLTTNGFLNHACDIICELRSADYFNTEYNKHSNEVKCRILNIIRRLVECYIGNPTFCSDVDATYPKILLGIMFQILNMQQQYLDASPEDAETVSAYYENYTQYCKWKKIINSNLTMSTSLLTFLNII